MVGLGNSEIVETSRGLVISPARDRRRSSMLLLGMSLLPWSIGVLSLLRPPVNLSGVFVGFMGGALLVGFSFYYRNVWSEIELKTGEGKLVRLKHHWGRSDIEGELPFSELDRVSVSEKQTIGGESTIEYGELRLVQTGGAVWARVRFDSTSQARQAKKVIVAWIESENRLGQDNLP